MKDFVKINDIINGQSKDPFAILGMHLTDQGIEINVFIPQATRIFLLDKHTQTQLIELTKIDEAVFFLASF